MARCVREIVGSRADVKRGGLYSSHWSKLFGSAHIGPPTNHKVDGALPEGDQRGAYS